MIAIPSQLLQCIYTKEELFEQKRQEIQKTINLILGIFFATSICIIYPFVAKKLFSQEPHPYTNDFSSMMTAIAFIVIVMSFFKITIIKHAYTPIKGHSLLEFLQTPKPTETLPIESQRKSFFSENPLYTQSTSTDNNIYSEHFHTLYFYSSKNPCLLALVKRVYLRENRELAPIEIQQIVDFFILEHSLQNDDSF